MAVTVELKDLDYARIQFERLLARNGKSTDKKRDGTYYYQKTEDYWTAYLSGFRAGRDSAGSTCEF